MKRAEDDENNKAIPPGKSILVMDNISVSFDGFKALNNLSFIVMAGEMRAIIGPNGAGKTTMMDVITGKTKPDTGDIIFKHSYNLNRLDEPTIANIGIGRKFQKPSVFENLTVFENLWLAVKADRRINKMFNFKVGDFINDTIYDCLETIGLSELNKKMAGSLSHGQKQWLEIGILYVQKPELLLIDEPVAGMTDEETETTSSLLKRISKSQSIVVVEHDMAFIESLDVPVTVLHEGSVLAEGEMTVIREDERVIEVYLGR